MLTNKLIADFMELNYSYFDKTIQKHFYYTPEEYKIWFDKHQNEITPDEMLYHKSWDWLMDVVDKILSLDSPKEESKGWYAYHGIRNNLELVDIKLTYKQVTEFIKWHNNYK